MLAPRALICFDRLMHQPLANAPVLAVALARALSVCGNNRSNNSACTSRWAGA